MPLRIANAAGFLGDSLDAPRLTVELAKIDYLTLEYLAELTMAILGDGREEPAAGLCYRFSRRVGQPRTGIDTASATAGDYERRGVNPVAMAAHAAGAVLVSCGLPSRRIAVVTGDDLLDRLLELQEAGCRFEHMDTAEALTDLTKQVICANAYLRTPDRRGAFSALNWSLPAAWPMHRSPWGLQSSTTVGRGTTGTRLRLGGRSFDRMRSTNHGRPVSRLARALILPTLAIRSLKLSDGSCVITKPASTGGLVDRQTVAEQLVYEIGDPAHYLTPDVDVDFTTVTLDDLGDDRVAVQGATGRAAPDHLKVSIAYRDGYQASGQLLVYGRDCVSKAVYCADAIRRRLARAGFECDRWHVECLGTGESVPRDGSRSAVGTTHDGGNITNEIVLRITARDVRREAIERFAKEFAPLITSGPPGLAGYAGGRPPVRPAFGFWPACARGGTSTMQRIFGLRGNG